MLAAPCLVHGQVEAERKKRSNILDSEGDRMSAINRAEGQRQSVILVSEAIQMEQINKAKGQRIPPPETSMN